MLYCCSPMVLAWHTPGRVVIRGSVGDYDTVYAR